jgi:lipopolysaccharide transport system ATP-binding protein
VIGRNGAGKSTLLKILSRITEPTEGRAVVRGRVGSLLEVGTGFHPELTGRENVYLNGAILGMKRAEVDRKFDEIVAFAEIEKFIDTPVKHYSSGMYVRLAFSVAAHLDTDILLVDEVLSVGDAGFQKKCLSKMESSTSNGKTVLFVSHNMNAVKGLCQRAVLLEDGHVANDGDSNSVVDSYLARAMEAASEEDLTLRRYERKEKKAQGVWLSSAWAELPPDATILTVDTPARLGFSVRAHGFEGMIALGLFLVTIENQIVLNSVSKYFEVLPGINTFYCELPPKLLNDETYIIRVQLIDENWRIIDDVRRVGVLCVADSGRTFGYMGKWGGVVRPQLVWHSSNGLMV